MSVITLNVNSLNILVKTEWQSGWEKRCACVLSIRNFKYIDTGRLTDGKIHAMEKFFKARVVMLISNKSRLQWKENYYKRRTLHTF